jgi:hypothetical protein
MDGMSVIKTALKRFDLCEDAETKRRGKSLDDLKFSNGDQWPEQIRTDRENEQRPCLTLNRTQRFIKQVVNDIRQVRPSGKARPVDSAADPDTAEMMNGLIRAIEQSCNAEIAYDWATEYAVTMGFGYFRITCDYTDPESFEKDIIIKRIRNPFSVYLDPNSKEPDGSDAKYGFVIDELSKEEFDSKYPDAETEFRPAGTGDRGWINKDTARVAEYWELEEETMKLSMLEDGSMQWGEVEGAVQVRDSKKTTLIQRIITCDEVLEEKKYPWKYIPIIPVLGEEVDIEGEVELKGMVRDLKDPQMQYNYMRSAMVERIALAPKSPWVGPTGAFKSPKWRSANKKNHAFLEWDTNAVKEAGIPPQRTSPPDVSTGLVQEVNTSSEEFKAISGIYDPGLGDRSNEVSGTAINARKVQSDIANFHFVDNLARSIRHGWRVMLDMIPTIYDSERVVRILKPNGEEEAVMVNRPYVDPKTQKERNYQLTAGKYDVIVDIGPSYATQRQEAVENMIEMVKAFPQSVEVMGDLIAKNMDWPESDEIAKRLKLLLPVDIAAEENPQVKAMQKQYEGQIQQGMQYIQMLESQIQQMAQKLDDKDGELQIKLGELRRKHEEMMRDYEVDMTKLELEYQKTVPGAVL